MPASPVPDQGGAGGGSGSGDCVGGLLARVLRQLAADRPLAAGDGLSLSHVPSSTLGRERGLDLRWELQLVRGGVVQAYDNGASPAEVLALFVDGDAAGAADDDSDGDAAGPPQEAEAWERAGPLLAEVAARSHRLLSEDAVIDLTARWDTRWRPPGWYWRPRRARWAWRLETAVGDALDDPQVVLAWEGRSPLEVLEAALADAARWVPR